MSKRAYSSLERGRLSPNAKSVQPSDPRKSTVFLDSLETSSPKKKLKQRFLNQLKQESISKSSAVLSYVPASDNDSSDSDDLDSLLINTAKVKTPIKQDQTSSAPAKNIDPTRSTLQEIKKELNKSAPRSNSPPESEKENQLDLIASVLDKKAKPEEVKEKFKNTKIPSVTNSRSALRSRINKHIDIIPNILNGTLHTSYYYQIAKQYKDKFPNQTIRQRDKYSIRWEELYAGYFGLKRQLYVSSVVLSKYRSLIYETSKKNATVAFWGTDDFSKYVLANEILIRLAMEDLHVSFTEAETFLSKTAEYGTIVTDLYDLEDEIAPAESPSDHTAAEETKMKNMTKISDMFDVLDDEE